MRFKFSFYLVPLISICLGGCIGFGPTSINRDRYDYINAIANSWKKQSLLNIVKLRYGDTPVFLEIGQIISGYQLQGSFAAEGTLNSLSTFGDIARIGSSGSFTDRPTITYTPLTGAHFLKVMITPIPPSNLLKLVQTGWSVEGLLQIGAHSINGLSNRQSGSRGYAADPKFVQLLAALQRLQTAGALEFRIKTSPGTKQEDVLMSINHQDISQQIKADRDLVTNLLGLASDLQEFKVVYGAKANNKNEIAILTHSGLRIMAQLASEIEVPPDHIAEKRTYPPIIEPAGTLSLPPLTRIHAQKSQPDDAFVAVEYRDYWYWIDDKDLRSKTVLTFLMVILTLAEGDKKAPSPVVTVQGN